MLIECKILEQVIKKLINKHLEKIVTMRRQHKHSKNKLYKTNLISILFLTWLLNWQISTNVCILYLDISKAFDKISHDMP